MTALRKNYREPEQRFYSERLGQPIIQRYRDADEWEREKRARKALYKNFRRWAIHRGLWPSKVRSRP